MSLIYLSIEGGGGNGGRIIREILPPPSTWGYPTTLYGCFNACNIILFINILHIFPADPPQYMITNLRKQEQTSNLITNLKTCLGTTNLQTQPKPD